MDEDERNGVSHDFYQRRDRQRGRWRKQVNRTVGNTVAQSRYEARSHDHVADPGGADEKDGRSGVCGAHVGRDFMAPTRPGVKLDQPRGSEIGNSCGELPGSSCGIGGISGGLG